MIKTKTLPVLLLLYVLLQLLSLILPIGLFLVAYLIIYLVAIFAGCKYIIINIIEDNNLRYLGFSILLFFAANCTLFLIYIPTLIYNTEINWRLKGEAEVDPMILQAYVPPIFFIGAVVVFVLSALVTKLVISGKN